MNSIRIPLNLFSDRRQVAKALGGILDESSKPAGMDVDIQQIRAREREPANLIVRRYLTGEIDWESLTKRTVDALLLARAGGPLGMNERALVSLVSPEAVEKPDPMSLALVRMTAAERAELKRRVEAYVKEMLNYNAGAGGGSVDGRHFTLGKSVAALEETLK